MGQGSTAQFIGIRLYFFSKRWDLLEFSKQQQERKNKQWNLTNQDKVLCTNIWSSKEKMIIGYISLSPTVISQTKTT